MVRVLVVPSRIPVVAAFVKNAVAVRAEFVLFPQSIKGSNLISRAHQFSPGDHYHIVLAIRYESPTG